MDGMDGMGWDGINWDGMGPGGTGWSGLRGNMWSDLFGGAFSANWDFIYLSRVESLQHHICEVHAILSD